MKGENHENVRSLPSQSRHAYKRERLRVHAWHASYWLHSGHESTPWRAGAQVRQEKDHSQMSDEIYTREEEELARYDALQAWLDAQINSYNSYNS